MEIPAPSDAIDVCVSKHQSALIGGDGDPTPPQGRRPEDIGHRAEEQKPSFLRKQEKRRAQREERGDLLMVGGVNEVSDGQPPRTFSVETYQSTNALNPSESTYSGTQR